MFWKLGEQYTGLLQLIRESEGTVYVHQDDFRSSEGRFILSEGFSACHGVVFLDPYLRKGALAHISGASDPKMLVDGWVGHVLSGEWREVEKLSHIFPQPKNVQVINVSHEGRHPWWHNKHYNIERALESVGITQVQHVSITTSPWDGSIFHRGIALDIERKQVYIFPNNRTSLITVPF